jgi:hypothetical protein
MKAMKLKFNLFIILCAAMMTVKPAQAQETTRKFSRSWPVREVETLSITNKYGEVKVIDTGDGEVTVDVVVSSDNQGKKAESILDKISVEFDKSGSTAIAETKFDSGFKSEGKFTVDYTVKIPADKNLVINLKFGNAVVQKLTGKGDFDIAYGNLTANELSGFSTRLNLAYGKADIESLGDAKVSLAYSKLFIGKGTVMELDSKYSGVNADEIREIRLTSKYDAFALGETESVEGESKFTNYKIKVLEKKLRLESSYGTVRVERIPAGFEEIDIISGYAQVSLGIDESASYQINASCDYCNINYPREKFRGNRMSENTSQQIDGNVNEGTGGKVKIKSRYGNIQLVK